MNDNQASPELVIRLNGRGGTVSVEQEVKGITTVKNITVTDFLHAVLGGMEYDDISSGLLPDNCIGYTWSKNESVTVTLLCPERRADIMYYEELFESFPLPRLVFQFRLFLGGRIERTRLGVIGEGRLQPQTPMYRYPFSNVHGDGLLCTGSNSMPKYDKLHTLSTLPQYILGMPNNDDYFSETDNRMGYTQAQLMQYLKDKEPEIYYTDVLVPNGKTLQDFLGGSE